MLSKVFEAKDRVFIFGARAASGYSSAVPQPVILLPAFGVQEIDEGATELTINHYLNQEGLGLILFPNWNTTVYWTELLPDSASASFGGFGSQAPAGAKVFWEASFMPIQDITIGANSATITHNMNDVDIPLFVTPNWNTTVFDSTVDRTVNTAKVYFGSEAQGTAPQIVWRVVD